MLVDIIVLLTVRKVKSRIGTSFAQSKSQKFCAKTE